MQQHKDVKDVGVVGAPDPIAGELPTAFIVKTPKANVTEKELIDYVAKKVSVVFLKTTMIFLIMIIHGKILNTQDIS